MKGVGYLPPSTLPPPSTTNTTTFLFFPATPSSTSDISNPTFHFPKFYPHSITIFSPISLLFPTILLLAKSVWLVHSSLYPSPALLPLKSIKSQAYKAPTKTHSQALYYQTRGVRGEALFFFSYQFKVISLGS